MRTLLLPLALALRTSESVTFLHRGSDHAQQKPKALYAETSGATNATVSDQKDVFQKVDLAHMPIEDQVMGLNEQQKQEMYNDVTAHGSVMGQAVNFVRSHANDGWSWCANDGHTCHCTGQARYGSHEGGYPTFSNPSPVSGSIACQGPNFQPSIAWRNALHCQCADANEQGWQNVRLRYTSISYFQEAWISLTRVLSQAHLLPFSGDRSWGGEQLFSVRGSGSHDRTFMDIFLKEAAQYLPQTPVNCIEWSPVTYSSQYPGCASGVTFALDYEPDMSKMHLDAHNHLHCDNVHLGHCLGAHKIDIAINTNVWEHEIEPFAAMQSLYEAMNPGAVMLFTVPFVAPYHGVPYDFYRYTKSGVTHLLERAGFCVPRSRMASGGDFINDIALFAGVGPGDFSRAEIEQAYHRGYDNIPDGALVMMAVAIKKVNVHDPCPA